MSPRPLALTAAWRGPLALFAALAFAALAAFAAASPAPAGAQTTENVCPEESTVDPTDPRIIVDAPSEDAEITSPTVISGEAAVFEANVQITIYDAQGEAIVETFTTAEGAAPEMHPFASDPIDFTVDETQAGCVWVYEEDMSGGEGDTPPAVAVPVTLVAEEDPTDPTDPTDPQDAGEFDPEPTAGGVTLTAYTGSLEQLQADAETLDLVSCFATEDGAFIGHIFGAPEFVNSEFNTQFADGFDARNFACRRA